MGTTIFQFWYLNKINGLLNISVEKKMDNLIENHDLFIVVYTIVFGIVN